MYLRWSFSSSTELRMSSCSMGLWYIILLLQATPEFWELNIISACMIRGLSLLVG